MIERRGRRPHPLARPLARRPKHLTDAPQLFDNTAQGAGGLVRTGEREPRRPDSTAPPGGQGDVTDEAGALLVAEPQRSEVDLAVRARARRIAARLSVPSPRSHPTGRPGPGGLVSMSFRGGSDDIDVDRTLEVLAGTPIPEDRDIVVRERVRHQRDVVLLVDISGSMRGERICTAAAAVGALAGTLVRDRMAVVAFWSDAAVLLHLGRPHPMALLDQLLALPTEGLTNVGFPLEVAARELSRSVTQDARAVLLSDCVHNAGPDPRPLAARLPRLDVILDESGESDPELASDLAWAGRGRLYRATTYRDVAPALSAIFRG